MNISPPFVKGTESADHGVLFLVAPLFFNAWPVAFVHYHAVISRALVNGTEIYFEPSSRISYRTPLEPIEPN